MTRIVVKTKISSDGVLHLDLPIGMKEADTEVQITVEPVSRAVLSQEEWVAFIQRTAGSITDLEFQRWEQGEYEVREPLP